MKSHHLLIWTVKQRWLLYLHDSSAWVSQCPRWSSSFSCGEETLSVVSEGSKQCDHTHHATSCATPPPPFHLPSTPPPLMYYTEPSQAVTALIKLPVHDSMQSRTYQFIKYLLTHIIIGISEACKIHTWAPPPMTCNTFNASMQYSSC